MCKIRLFYSHNQCYYLYQSDYMPLHLPIKFSAEPESGYRSAGAHPPALPSSRETLAPNYEPVFNSSACCQLRHISQAPADPIPLQV